MEQRLKFATGKFSLICGTTSGEVLFHENCTERWNIVEFSNPRRDIRAKYCSVSRQRATTLLNVRTRVGVTPGSQSTRIRRFGFATGLTTGVRSLSFYLSLFPSLTPLPPVPALILSPLKPQTHPTLRSLISLSLSLSPASHIDAWLCYCIYISLTYSESHQHVRFGTWVNMIVRIIPNICI